MKFKDALHQALEKIEKSQGKTTAVTAQTAKILAIMWNMMAVSKNVVDDIVIIDDNRNIISIPLSPEKEEKVKDEKVVKPGKKSKVKKGTAEPKEAVNAESNEKTTPEE